MVQTVYAYFLDVDEQGDFVTANFDDSMINRELEQLVASVNWYFAFHQKRKEIGVIEQNIKRASFINSRNRDCAAFIKYLVRWKNFDA